MFNLGSIVAKITADVTGFQQGLNQAKKDLGAFSNGITTVAEKIGEFTQIATVAAVAAAGFLGKKAIDDAAEYEQQVIALTTLLGDTAKAQEHIKTIQKDALKTPFDVSGLIKGNQLLISAGVGAKQAEKDILNLGDAISANGKGAAELDRIVVNLQQIKNVGSATEMDMRQFAFNGINMYQLLADSTGLNIEKLKDMDITYEMISQALAKASGEGGKYAGSNERQSASLVGLRSNLNDTVTQTLINIANQTGLFEATKQVTAALIDLVTNVAPPIIAFLKDFALKIAEVTKFLNEHRTEIEVVTGILTAFFLPALIAVAIQMAINTAMSIKNATLAVIEFGIEGWKAIAMLVAKAVQLGVATAAFIVHTTVTTASAIATGVLTAATWLLNAALIILTSPIFLVVAAIAALIAIGVLLWKNWDTVKQFGKDMLDFLTAKFNDFVHFLQGIGGMILDALIKPFTDAWNKIKEIADKIKGALDPNQRHSPSLVDRVQAGVADLNKAWSDLAIPITGAPTMAGLASSPGGMSSPGGGISIDLRGSTISSEQDAQRLAEVIGDNIIKQLNLNVRF